MFSVYYLDNSEIHYLLYVFVFQAEDGIRDLVRSRGLGDVYKRQVVHIAITFRLKGSHVVDKTGKRKTPAFTPQVSSLSLIHI